MRSKIVDALPKLSWGFFCATIVLIPFRFRILLLARPVDLIWKDYTDFLLFAADITLLLALVFWLVDLFLRPHRINTGPSFLTLPLAGLTLAALVTSITSIDPALSFYHSIRLITLFGFYLYIVNHVSSIKQLAVPLGLMVSIQAVVAIAQVLAQRSIGLQWLGEYELDPAWRGVSVVWTATVRSLRAYGLSDHPNILGGCFAFAILLLFVWLVHRESKWQSLVTGVLVAGVIGLLLTFSRSAWLGGLSGFAFIAFQLFRGKDRDSTLKALALVGAVVVLLLPFVYTNRELLGVRLGAGGSFEKLPAEIGSLGERRVLMDAANQVFSKNALLGVGLGATPLAFQRDFPGFTVNYQPAHVVLLTAAVETGLFGALFYLALLAAPWIALYLNRSMKMTPDLIAASAVLLAITAVGFFDYYPWLWVPGRLWQYLAWGLWAKVYIDASRASAETKA